MKFLATVVVIVVVLIVVVDLVRLGLVEEDDSLEGVEGDTPFVLLNGRYAGSQRLDFVVVVVVVLGAGRVLGVIFFIFVIVFVTYYRWISMVT